MRYTHKPSLALFGSVAAVGALLLTGCTGNASGDEGGPVQISVGSPPSIFSLGVRTAVEEGLFEERGLDVEIVDIQAASEGAALLTNGDIQFAQFDVHNTILAVSEGQDLLMTAPIATTAEEASDDPHGFGSLLVAADGPVQSLADLEGKKIGTNTIGGTAYLDFYQKLEQAGVDMSTVEWIQVPSPQQVSALKQGQIDAATVAEPNVSIGIVAGDVRSIAQADDVMKGAPNFGFVSSGQWAEENGEAVEKFREALVEANTKLNSDRALAEEMVASYMDLDAEVVKTVKLPHFAEEPFTAEGIKPVADRLVEFELLTESEVPALDTVVLAE
jgi:NitT/TauT family transport system substrate-binding protein